MIATPASRQPPGNGPTRAWPGPRLGPAAVLVAAVLGVHAWLLTGLPTGLGADDRAGATPLVVRQLLQPRAPQPPQAATSDEAAPSPPAAPPLAGPTRRPAPAAPGTDGAVTPGTVLPDAQVPTAVPPLADAPQADVAALDDAVPPAASAAQLAHAAQTAGVTPGDRPAAALAQPVPDGGASTTDAPSPAPASAAPVPTAEPGPADAAGQRLPTYATLLPPATVLHYELRRGLLTGAGELAWRPQAGRYELAIEGTAFGVPVLTQLSVGGFDAAGLAPQRFVDRRRGRDVRAANFQRDKGVISWSTTPAEVPLQPGAQDRLSWMLQLAAVVSAEPARFSQPGAQVLMQVAGARGDVDVWTLVVTGREAVDVVGQRIADALVLRRAPRKPFDTEAQVWLDPARHHLLVRLRLATAGAGNDSLEFVLKP